MHQVIIKYPGGEKSDVSTMLNDSDFAHFNEMLDRLRKPVEESLQGAFEKKAPNNAGTRLKESLNQAVNKIAANKATDLLSAAAERMKDRAKEYDKPEGERSMDATVKAFNAITGNKLTESEGWIMMICLKLVRGHTAPTPHVDSIEDLVAYSALMGEARLKG